jgi:pyruvate dehydrogenase E2 component (dihydrolipoamide acetyltransferase)
MPVDLVMPRLSDTMTEGTVARWLKKPGEAVKRGEPLAEIETDKATMPMEAFEDGTMGPVDVAEGQTVPLGSKIGVLYRAGEKADGKPAPTGGQNGEAETGPSAAPAAGGGAAASEAPAAATRAAARDGAATRTPSANGGTRSGERSEAPSGEREGPPSQQTLGTSADRASGRSDVESAGGKVRASPLARRIANEHNVDLTRIEGTGPGGRIVRADVEEVMAGPTTQKPEPAPSGELKPFTRIQAVVARRMVESKTTVPHIYLTVPIDMGKAMQLRAESNEYLGKERGFSVNDLFVKAAALALRAHPIVNAGYAEGGIQMNAQVNVGNAVAIEGGLVVPVIRDADKKSLPEIGAEMRALAEKARSGKLALADYEGGTFTISNLGMFGVEEFDAVVNPPQSAILAVGAVMDEAIVVDGQVVAGKRCRVTLSADHRVVYGADAAEFLRTLKGLLEAPFALVYG